MKKIYFKDLIKDKSYEDLMKLIPCMVCREDLKEDYLPFKYRSYDVIGFGPDYVILGDYTDEYDEDAMWGDGRYTLNTYEKVRFEDIDESYIFAHPLTEKQKEWYIKHEQDPRCVTGYEAWAVINEHVQKVTAQREKMKNARRYEYDDDDGWDEYYYDIPNM